MVNSTGFLEDGDPASSPAHPYGEDDDIGKYSGSESDLKGVREDGDGSDDEEEIAPTHRDWRDLPHNISFTDPSGSGAIWGSSFKEVILNTT